MNVALRMARVSLENERKRTAVNLARISSPNMEELNCLTTAAESDVWINVIKQQILVMYEKYEQHVHHAKNPQEVFEARGASNGLVELLERIDGAKDRRLQLQENQQMQDAVPLVDMVSPGTDHIGGRNG